MLSVRLYCNTGFNINNLPYNGSILDTMQGVFYHDCPVIDLLQTKGFGKISVKWPTATTAYPVPDLDSVDYIKVSGSGGDQPYQMINNSTYYLVRGYSRTSADVVEFEVVEDFVTSLGGMASLKFSDGIITRETPASNTWGDSIVEDELLGCVNPLELTYKWLNSSAAGESSNTLIESTLDLTSATGISYQRIDDTSGGSPQSALIPVMSDADRNSTYQIETNAAGTAVSDVVNPTGASIYMPGEPNVLKNIANARSLGIENGVLNQYVLPAGMATVTIEEHQGINRSNIKGKCVDLQTTTGNEDVRFLPEDFDPTTQYYRVYQGENNKIGIMSATGDRVEFLPEDIRQGSDVRPTITRIVDPRAEGRPYYQSKYFKGKGAPSLFNAVSGAKWSKLPLKYTDISGVDILEQQFDNTSKLSARQFAGTQAQLKNALSGVRLGESLQATLGLAGLAGKAGSGIAQAWAGGSLPGATPDGMNASLFGSTGGMIQAGAEYAKNMAIMMGAVNAADIALSTNYGVYQRERQKELYSFGVIAYTRAPEISFPADINTMRDLTENGVLIYQLRPSQADLERHRRILNMYGVKTLKPITDISFNVNTFTYIEIQGAQVCGTTNQNVKVSQWERDGVSAQLSAGVRVWMVKPDPSYYTRSNINTR